MISRSHSKNQGFASVTLMLFFPLFFALLFSIAFVGYLIQHKTRLRSMCFLEATEIQKSLIYGEEALFNLNPAVKALRLSLDLAYIELAAAVAADNPALVAEITEQITQIKNSQSQLDRVQQSIIRATELQLNIRSFLLQSKMQQAAGDLSSIWQIYLDGFTWVQISHSARMAVKRDSPDVAPVYELNQQYQTEQKLAYRWQHRFTTVESAQRLTSGENNLEMSCDVSARKEGSSWRLLINAVKF